MRHAAGLSVVTGQPETHLRDVSISSLDLLNNHEITGRQVLADIKASNDWSILLGEPVRSEWRVQRDMKQSVYRLVGFRTLQSHHMWMYTSTEFIQRLIL